MSENSQNRVAWPVAFGEAPRKGSRSMPQSLDFTIESSIGINLTYEFESERLEFVQAMFIDNSSNTAALNAVMRGTNQKIIIPAGWQGYIPVLASADNAHITFTTTGAPIVPVQFLSFPVPACLWPSSAIIPVSSGGTIGTDASANAPALLANLLATLAVNASRVSFEVQNQSAAQIQVVMDDGAGANQSIVLIEAGSGANTQGGSYNNTSERGRVRVFGGAANQQIQVRQN